MKLSLAALLRYVLGLGLGLSLLVLALRGLDWTTLRSVLIRLDPWLLAFSVVPMLLAHVLRAWRWRQLLAAAGEPVGIGAAFSSLLVGYLANLAVPRLGEITRCTLLARQSRTPFATAAGTVVTERAVDVLVLALLLAWLALTEGPRMLLLLQEVGGAANPNPTSLVWVVLAGATLVLGAALTVWWFGRRLLAWRPMQAAVGFTLLVWQAVLSVRHLRQPGRFALATVLIWACYGVNAWLALRSLPDQPLISLYLASQLMAIGAIGMAAPVPGGMGSFHALVVLGYVAFGLPRTAGQEAAIVLHGVSTATSLLGGLAAWLYLVGTRQLVPEKGPSAPK